jgi:4-alpha-glucanotransferase
MTEGTAHDRRAGILVPLTALRSPRNWGVGEIPDLAALSDWLGQAGHALVQLLPVGEPSPGQHSPYASRTAFAIDPLFIAMAEVEDFQAAGGERALGAADRAALERARAARRVDYETVRPLKWRALEIAFRRFAETEWRGRSRRARDLEAFAAEHARWLDDYALFRALQEAAPDRPWWEWDEPLRRRVPEALAERRAALEGRVLFFRYVQWLADRQWQAARREAAASGVVIKGDLPFMVSGDSADVWARQGEFRMDATVGAPPDAFSADGQDWGLPVYDFAAMAASGYAWLRDRARRAAELYDLYRIDHVVGFYRIYVRPKDGSPPHFVPADEREQLALGETLLKVLGGGARVVAEDLGVVPNFVRESLTRLGIPGYRVLRWEREWKAPGQPFHDPAACPRLSVATSGTHDTETMAEWWEAMPDEERRAILEIPALARLRATPGRAPTRFTPEVHDALLETLYGAGSDLVVLPVQDAFGMRDRINVPGTVGPENWSFRLPWTADDLSRESSLRARTETLGRLAARHGRLRA